MAGARRHAVGAPLAQSLGVTIKNLRLSPMRSMIQRPFLLARRWLKSNLFRDSRVGKTQWGLSGEVPESWSEKVEASRRSEALADAISPSVCPEVRKYLYKLLMRDAYPATLEDFLKLSVAYRRNTVRLYMHDCATKEDYDEAVELGPKFEDSLKALLSTEQIHANETSRGDA